MKEWLGLKLFAAGITALILGLAVGCESPQIGPTGVDTTDAFHATSQQKISPFMPDMGHSLAPRRGLTLAATTCTFTVSGIMMLLDADCETSETLWVPHGMVLDGQGYTVTMNDPAGGHFLGAAIQNGGTWAGVQNLTVQGGALSNICDPSSPVDTRLRGIMFDGAEGFIKDNTVNGVNQGASGCQEGNSIEVRNAPFDGTHPNTRVVDIVGNTVTAYQKSGIVANGDVNVSIHDNTVGESATQDNLAANAIQIGFGALASTSGNDVMGNQWKTASAVATAILAISSTSSVFENYVHGNADVGIYHFGTSGSVHRNTVRDEGTDVFWGTGDPDFPDWGIGQWSVSGNAHHNSVCGFADAYDGNIGPKNTGTDGNVCP